VTIFSPFQCENNFLKLRFQKKVKNATSLRVAYRRYCCFNTSNSNFNNDILI